MKRTVRLAILGTMLQGSAHAAEPSATAEPLPGKESISHSASAAAEKNAKAMRGKKAKSKTKEGAEKIDPQAKVNQDNVTETKPGAIEQSVQLRGVRG